MRGAGFGLAMVSWRFDLWVWFGLGGPEYLGVGAGSRCHIGELLKPGGWVSPEEVSVNNDNNKKNSRETNWWTGERGKVTGLTPLGLT